MHTRTFIFRIILQLSFLGLSAAQCADFFSSKIYNNNNSNTVNSTFTVLETIPGFDLQAAKLRKDIKNIFVIINGQQGPCGKDCTGEKSDNLFGRKLTGGHRISGGESYQVYLPHLHNSLAGTLYDQYSDNSIILDVLNPKYNWEHKDQEKKQTERYLRDIIQELLQTHSKQTNLCIVGFSRGALLAYKLALELKGKANIKALITIDPVINPLSSDVQNVMSTAHYKLRAKKWELTNKKLLAFVKPIHNFPVLKNPQVPSFNVFQRHGLFSLGGGQFGKPIGSAIEGALSPCKTEGICALFNGDSSKHSPFDQYDSAVAYHSPDMPQKYANWALDIALKTMPLPQSVKAQKIINPPKPLIKRLVGRTSLYTGDKVNFYWRSNQGGLEYQSSLTPVGQPSDWGDWDEDRYNFTYALYEAGYYSFKVRARNKVGDMSAVKSTVVHIKSRPPHLRYVGASDRVATPGMTIFFQWKAAEDDLDYKIQFFKVGGTMNQSKSLHAENEYKVTLYDQGDYVFRLQAFTQKGIPSRIYSRALSITDYIYPDEILIGSPPFNPPSDPYDPKEFRGVFAVAKLVNRPEESKDKYWEGRVSISTPDWEENTLFRSPWAIEKSMPARKEHLKVGQTIVYSGWNPQNPAKVRGSAMSLDIIDDLSQIDNNIVGASWPNIDDPSRMDKKKLYLHNIRVCLKPINCLSVAETQSDVSQSSVKKIYLNDKENTILMDSEIKQNIVLDKDELAVFQIIETTQDKQWVIVIMMPAHSTGSRAQSQYLLYNSLKKKKFTQEQLGKNIGEFYGFKSSNGQLSLSYLNTSTGNVSSLSLESIMDSKK